MIKEAAYTLGLVETLPEDQRLAERHPILTTDHNTFFSDDDVVKVGPTSQRGV
jgi:hypothetical protein